MAKQLNIGTVEDDLYERFELVKAALCSRVKSVVRSSKGFEFLLCCAERELGICENEDDPMAFPRNSYSFSLSSHQSDSYDEEDDLPEYDGEPLAGEGTVL